MTAKNVNYTAEMTAEVVGMYGAGDSIEMIAQHFGKSVRSIVAKLSSEGVYIAKKATATKEGAMRVTKADLVAQIALTLGREAEQLSSLEKASHEALTLVANALAANQ